MLDLNNDSEADFKEAGLELKTTPLKRNKNGSLSAKERLVIGMIDYMKVVDETFETSHLMEKAEDILLISYLWVPDTDPLDYRVELVEIVSMPGLPEGDLAQIKADWETVVNKIREPMSCPDRTRSTSKLAQNRPHRRRAASSRIPASPQSRAPGRSKRPS